MRDPPDQLHQQNSVLIPLDNELSAIVDPAWDAPLCLFHWRPVRRRRCYYAYTYIPVGNLRGSISMSRIIAQTPTFQVCHHRNRNPLDNRRSNLLNMNRSDHQLLHRNNTLLVKHGNGQTFRSLS